MPRPIRETPILFGKDGKRFEEKNAQRQMHRNAETVEAKPH